MTGVLDHAPGDIAEVMHSIEMAATDSFIAAAPRLEEIVAGRRDDQHPDAAGRDDPVDHARSRVQDVRAGNVIIQAADRIAGTRTARIASRRHRDADGAAAGPAEVAVAESASLDSGDNDGEISFQQ